MGTVDPKYIEQVAQQPNNHVAVVDGSFMIWEEADEQHCSLDDSNEGLMVVFKRKVICSARPGTAAQMISNFENQMVWMRLKVRNITAHAVIFLDSVDDPKTRAHHANM